MTTDDDIPILCAECPGATYFEGIDEIKNHILQVHKNYSPEEAEKYALIWMESAYERIAEQEMEWAAEYKRNRRIR
jgi:hypothetical protein